MKREDEERGGGIIDLRREPLVALYYCMPPHKGQLSMSIERKREDRSLMSLFSFQNQAAANVALTNVLTAALSPVYPPLPSSPMNSVVDMYRYVFPFF